MLLAVLVLLALPSACASLGRAPVAATAGSAQESWSGRLALSVHGAQAQSFSAAFDLSGTAERGELRLYGPLGTTLAQLQWTPQGATLQQGHSLTHADSVQSLLLQVTGTDLPLAALFDWLHGRQNAAPGWQAELGQLAEGRLSMQRSSPEPVVQLRVVLDSP